MWFHFIDPNYHIIKTRACMSLLITYKNVNFNNQCPICCCFRNSEKANSRPLKEDWQDMPSTVKEIMRLKAQAKTMPRRRKRNKNKGLFL